jgi:hypothetical protein
MQSLGDRLVIRPWRKWQLAAMVLLIILILFTGSVSAIVNSSVSLYTTGNGTGALVIDPSYYLGQYSPYLVSAMNFNSSTLTVDDTGYTTWTNSGGVENTTTPKFGAGAAYFGTGRTNYIYGNANSNLAFGTNPFTIDFWYNTSAPATPQTIYDWRAASGSGAYSTIYISAGSVLTYYVNSAFKIIGGTTVTANVWHEIIVERSGTTTTMYLDGVSQGSWTDSTSYLVGASAPVLGNGAARGTICIIGSIDSAFVWNGVAIPITQLYPQTQEIGVAALPVTITANTTSGAIPLAVQFTVEFLLRWAGCILKKEVQYHETRLPVLEEHGATSSTSSAHQHDHQQTLRKFLGEHPTNSEEVFSCKDLLYAATDLCGVAGSGTAVRRERR